MATKILIADDDTAARTVLRDTLKTESWIEIIEVDDGQRALDLLCDRLRPELCIIDVRMPKLDGIELMQRMRRDPELKDLKIVATSSSRDRDTILAVSKLRVLSYLLKPYDVDKLRATLLPLIAPPAGETIADAAFAARNLLAKTLLVVDDEAADRTTLREIAKAEPGWEIVDAKDGQDALAQLRAGMRPDLVMLDLKMPTLDGQSLLQRMREDPELRRTPVVIISAAQDREKVRSLVQLQISGYLLKPFDAQKVRAAMRQAIGQVEKPATTPPVG